MPAFFLRTALLLVPLLGGTAAWAQTVDNCWPAVTLEPATTVDLQPIDKDKGHQRPELVYESKIETPLLQALDRKPLTAAKAGDEVRLGANAGQLVLRRGPLVLARNGLDHLLPASEPYDKEIEVRFAAPAGTRITLDANIADGKLPAGLSATVIVDGSEPLRTTLAAKVEAVPMPSGRARGWLDAGALPITRGGRMLEVDVYAPGRTAGELKAETFLACLGGSPALATTSAAQDGKATLLVHVPNQVFSGVAFWNNVRLQLLGGTTGLSSTPVEIRIGNPYIAFVVSIVLAIGILFLLAWLVERRTDTKPAEAWTLSRLFLGIDGEPSLSLFQMYMWTGLVVAGMIYVFCMSGDLLSISEQVLILLGLAGLSTISARLVSTTAATPPPQTQRGFWGMFVVCGKPDLLRLQMFLFTLVIWAYVAARLYYEQAFPTLDANVLLLMGISNGVYVGAKWAATGDPLAELKRLRLAQDTLQDGLTTAQSALDEAKGKNDAAAIKTAQDKVDGLIKRLDDAKSAYDKELARLSKP